MTQAIWESWASWLSLVVAMLFAPLLWVVMPNRPMDRCRQIFIKVASVRSLCTVLLPAISLAVTPMIALHRNNGRLPRPLIQDEYSYLLAADTFAHGRLTNPTPPFWEHLETPQQLMRPTYTSKYPPGQGLILALGQVATGLPIIGVWLTTAAAVVAVYWMLLGFLPPHWALLGGIVAMLHPQLLDWSENYWGGSLAVLGAALFLGAWGRLMLSATVGTSIAMGVGLIVLANSRPYEGLILASPLMIALMIRSGDHLVRRYLPAGILLLIGAVAMGYYNYRITGQALRMPFAEYTAQYDYYPKFWFMPMRPLPVYRNGAMEFIHRNFEVGSYLAIRTVRGFCEMTRNRVREIFAAQVKLAVLLIPLVVAVLMKKDRRIVLVWIAVGVFILGLWVENFVLPHYQAPLLPVTLLLVLVGWQKINRWCWRGKPLGQIVARAVAIGFLAAAGMAAAQPVDHETELVDQQELVQLSPALQSGKHLIFVQYAPLHSYHIEYVHNLSDPQQSKIIWARSFGPALDRPMANYYSDRDIWLLNVGGQLDLKPYLRSDVLDSKRLK